MEKWNLLKKEESKLIKMGEKRESWQAMNLVIVGTWQEKQIQVSIKSLEM